MNNVIVLFFLSVDAGVKRIHFRRFGSEPVSPQGKSTQQQSRLCEKWESRVLCGISKLGGKVCFWTFPRSVFSTAFAVAVSFSCCALPVIRIYR